MTDRSAQQRFYDSAYLTQGSKAQRRYPDEELCRFTGRRYFDIPFDDRRSVRILEAGCGSGANLWMIAREGFDAVGIDISQVALDLSREMLASYGTLAELIVGDMTALPLADASVEAVVDLFSSFCLNDPDGRRFLAESSRVTKAGGRFFSYFPSKRSDAWLNTTAVDGDLDVFIDPFTLNVVRRRSSPYFGNTYAFRFLQPSEYARLLEGFGFEVTYCETVSRTYRTGEEAFESVVIEGCEGLTPLDPVKRLPKRANVVKCLLANPA